MSFYGLGSETEMLEDALEAGGMAWWIMELPSGAVFFSPNKIAMLGYDQSDANQFLHFSSFTDLLHPDDYDKCMKAMQDHIKGKTDVYAIKYRIKAKNGEYVTMYDRGRVVARKGEEFAVAGIVLDISNNHSLISNT